MEANLVLLKKNGSQKSIPLPDGIVLIGRRHDCDLTIPLPTISRRHCEIHPNGEALKIWDLDSTWGTFINDARVKSEAPLQAGDAVRIGPLTFVCQIGGKPEAIVPPEPAKAEDVLAETAIEEVGDGLEDSFADLDASDSVIAFDESDSDIEDLSAV